VKCDVKGDVKRSGKRDVNVTKCNFFEGTLTDAFKHWTSQENGSLVVFLPLFRSQEQ
jgi:hypothetical protein